MLISIAKCKRRAKLEKSGYRFHKECFEMTPQPKGRDWLLTSACLCMCETNKWVDGPVDVGEKGEGDDRGRREGRERKRGRE